MSLVVSRMMQTARSDGVQDGAQDKAWDSAARAASPQSAPLKGMAPVAGASAVAAQDVGGALGLGELKIPTMEELEEKSAQFAEKLTHLLQAEGIDVSREIRLGMDRQGNVVVRGTHPDADKIEQIFKETEGLRDTYSEISAGYDIHAVAKAHDAYEQARIELDDEDDEDKEEQEKLYRKYRGLIEQIKASSGSMTLAGGVLASGAMQTVNAALGAPSFV